MLKEQPEWIGKVSWNLCPLCSIDESKRLWKMMTRELPYEDYDYRDIDGSSGSATSSGFSEDDNVKKRIVRIHLNPPQSATSFTPPSPSGLPSGCVLDGDDIVYEHAGSDLFFNLQEVADSLTNPTFEQDGKTAEWEIMGFSDDANDDLPMYGVDVVLSKYDFPAASSSSGILAIDEEGSEPSSQTMELYAIWRNKSYIVKFDAGDGSGSMDSVVVDAGVPTDLPECTFNPPGEAGHRFDYATGEKEQDVNLFRFSHWECGLDRSIQVGDGGSVQLVGTVKPGEEPMTTFTAMWKKAWIPV